MTKCMALEDIHEMIIESIMENELMEKCKEKERSCEEMGENMKESILMIKSMALGSLYQLMELFMKAIELKEKNMVLAFNILQMVSVNMVCGKMEKELNGLNKFYFSD